MPKLIGECGDLLLFGFVNGWLVSLMLVLRVQVRLIRVLKVLPGAFMSGQMIFFSVAFGAGTMGVGSLVAMFRRNLL